MGCTQSGQRRGLVEDLSAPGTDRDTQNAPLCPADQQLCPDRRRARLEHEARRPTRLSQSFVEQRARVLRPPCNDQGALREVLDEPGARECAATSRSTEDHLMVPHEYADRRIAESPNDPPRPTRS